MVAASWVHEDHSHASASTALCSRRCFFAHRRRPTCAWAQCTMALTAVSLCRAVSRRQSWLLSCRCPPGLGGLHATYEYTPQSSQEKNRPRPRATCAPHRNISAGGSPAVSSWPLPERDTRVSRVSMTENRKLNDPALTYLCIRMIIDNHTCTFLHNIVGF